MEKKYDMKKVDIGAEMIRENDELLKRKDGKYYCDENAPEEVKEFVKYKNYMVEQSKKTRKIHMKVFADFRAQQLYGE